MHEREYKRGVRNAWILTLLVLFLVAAWAAFSFFTNRNEAEPHFVQGKRDFVPGSSIYGMHYRTPVAKPQGD